MTRLLAVANEPPWPAHNGGRARMAGLLTALAERHEVTVLAASSGSHAHAPVRMQLLPPASTSKLAALAGSAPRLGAGLLGPEATAAVRTAAADAGVVLVTHSYLLPLLPSLPAPVVLDLPNLEVSRTASGVTTGGLVRRGISALEHLKARRWEPRAVRRADVCLAVTVSDAARAEEWGACKVLVAPNASAAAPLPPSPPDGHVLVAGDWTYAPNRAGLTRLLAHDWPRVSAARPGARLVVLGRGAPERLPAGVVATGYVDDLDPWYEDAAVVVAPARSGGGTQLKVVDAVARGRVVVLPPYGATSLPPHARGACLVAEELSSPLLQMLDDVAERHRRERVLLAEPVSWAASVAPLDRWLDGVVSRA
jgi:hypothetical protein